MERYSCTRFSYTSYGAWPKAFATLVVLLLVYNARAETAEVAFPSFVPLATTVLQEQAKATPVRTLAKGVLLVASQSLDDPRFAQTVILLLEYSDEGAMGVVLNRPTSISLSSVLPEVKTLKKRKETVSLGGPVGREQVLMLAHASHPPEHSSSVFEKCYVVANMNVLRRLLTIHDAALKLRAFVGYAGWAPGQIDAEVARQDWRLFAADEATVFDLAADRMWPDLNHQGEFEWTRWFRPDEGLVAVAQK